MTKKTEAKKKRGRPPVSKSELKRKTISLRLKADEVNMLREAAATRGKSLSSWVRKTLMESL